MSMSVYHLHARCPGRLEECIRVSDSYELLGACWESNLGRLKEFLVLLSTKTSLQNPLHILSFFVLFCYKPLISKYGI